MRPLTLLSVVCRAVATTMKTITARMERRVPIQPVDPADAGQGAVAELAAVRVADADGAEDDGGDAAREGQEEAAGAEEDEEDREGAEEEGGEGRDVAGLVRRWGQAAGRGAAHRGGEGRSSEADDGVADLDLVAGAEFDRAGDAVAVDVGAVGGAEVLDGDLAVVREDAGVAAGDAGVGDDHVGRAVLAAEDQLAVEGVLAARPCSCVDDQ